MNRRWSPQPAKADSESASQDTYESEDPVLKGHGDLGSFPLPLFDDDDLLGSVTADERGVFCVRGYTTEVTDIEPYIYIEHNCGYEGLDRKHFFTQEVPTEFVTEGNYSKKIYHVGDIELLTRDAPVQHYQRHPHIHDHRQFGKLSLHQQIIHCIPLYVAYKDYYERVVIVGGGPNKTVVEQQAWDEHVKTIPPVLGPPGSATVPPAPGPPGIPPVPLPTEARTIPPAPGPPGIPTTESSTAYIPSVTDSLPHYTEARGYVTPRYEDIRSVDEHVPGEEEQRRRQQERLEEEEARWREHEEAQRRAQEEQRRLEEERRLEEARRKELEEQRRLEDELRREEARMRDERLRLEEQERREHENRIREQRLKEEEERRRLEEERRRLEEERRIAEEERRLAEEKRLQEEEELRMKKDREYEEQHRREEELRREEQRLREEERRKEDELRREEERRHNEELRKELELRREEHKRRIEEFQKLEDQRRQELARFEEERRLWKEKLKAAEADGKKTQLLHIICHDGEVIRTPEARKELYTEGEDPCEEFKKV